GGVAAAPPGIGMPGPATPGLPNDPTAAKPKEDKPTYGSLTIHGPRLQDRTLTMTAKLDREAWDHRVTSYALAYFLLRKGKSDMAMWQPRAHDLGRALRAYADKNKMYPRGTKERGPSPVRMNRPWQPDEKISWMADLLPFLDHEDLYKQIVQDKSWRDTEN